MADAIISDIKGNAYVERNGTRVKLTTESEIQADDVVITDAEASVELRFSDGAVVRVGASSTLEVAEYVYTETDSSFVLNLAGGMMRSVSGAIVQQNPDAFRITTPRGTIGIRVTDTLHEIRSGGEVHAIMSIGQGHTVVITDRSGQSVVLSSSSQGVDLGDGVAMRMVQVPQQALTNFVNVLESGARPTDVGNSLYNAIHTQQKGPEDGQQEGAQQEGAEQENTPQTSTQSTGEGQSETQANAAPTTTHLSQTATDVQTAPADLPGVDAVVAAVIKLLGQAQTIVLSTLSVNTAHAADMGDLSPTAAVSRMVENHVSALDNMKLETSDTLFAAQDEIHTSRPAPADPVTPEQPSPNPAPEQPSPEPTPDPVPPTPEPDPVPPTPEPDPVPPTPEPVPPTPEPDPVPPTPEDPGSGGGGGGGTPPLTENRIGDDYTYEFLAGSQRIIGNGSSVVSLPSSNLVVEVKSPSELVISNGVENNRLELVKVKEIMVIGSGGTLDVGSVTGRVVLESGSNDAHKLVVTTASRSMNKVSFTGFDSVSGNGTTEMEFGTIASLRVDVTGTGIDLTTLGNVHHVIKIQGITEFKGAAPAEGFAGTNLEFGSLAEASGAYFRNGALHIQQGGDELTFKGVSVEGGTDPSDLIALSGDVVVTASRSGDSTHTTTLTDASGSMIVKGVEHYVLSETTDVNFADADSDTIRLKTDASDGGVVIDANAGNFSGKLGAGGAGVIDGGSGSGDKFVIDSVNGAEFNVETRGLTYTGGAIEKLEGFETISLADNASSLKIVLDADKSETVDFSQDGFSVVDANGVVTPFSNEGALLAKKHKGFSFGNDANEDGPADVLLIKGPVANPSVLFYGGLLSDDGTPPVIGSPKDQSTLKWDQIKDWNVVLKIDGGGTYKIYNLMGDVPNGDETFRLGDIGTGSGLSKLDLGTYSGSYITLGTDSEQNLTVTVDRDSAGTGGNFITLILEGHTVAGGSGNEAVDVYSALVNSSVISGPTLT